MFQNIISTTEFKSGKFNKTKLRQIKFLTNLQIPIIAI